MARMTIFCALVAGATTVASPLSDLKATARNGQVFLTWKEAETPDRTTLDVFVAKTPIRDVSQAKRVGHHIERHSARDWWEDPASFKKGARPGQPAGFCIQAGSERLDPFGGLFVHTVRPELSGTLHFAVTRTGDTQILATTSARAEPGEIEPIWQHGGEPPAPGAGKGKALWLSLHAKSGVIANSEYLVFGDETMGWREGLPFKFSVRVQGDEVVVRPTDRVWINRPHHEASDAGTPAIWTFWYGYNSNIFDRQLMAKGVPTNYTERRLLWILGWVRRHYQPDPARWYCSGSSMGGCGTVSFGWRHPELFAACHARVPIVSYTYLGKGSAVRLEPACWIGRIPPDLRTNEGIPLLERMNSMKFVSDTQQDLPFLFMIHGRRDGSIPWENNPPFYRALSAARQGFAVYWDNGEHPTAGKNAPADVKAWEQRFRQFRRDESYPAFTNTSTDRNPGNGAPDDGDLVGWINRGMDWKNVEDTSDRYAITILADYPGLEYPVRTDVTLRRLQRFKARPGEKLLARLGNGPPVTIAADVNGRIPIPAVVIPDKNGTRLILTKTGRSP